MLPLFFGIAFAGIILVYIAWKAWVCRRPELPYSLSNTHITFGGFKGVEHLLSVEQATPVDLEIPLVDIHRVEQFKFKKYHGSQWGKPYQHSPGTLIAGDYFEILYAGKMDDYDRYQCLETDHDEDATVTVDQSLCDEIRRLDETFEVSKSFRNTVMLEVLFSYGILAVSLWVILVTPAAGLILAMLISNIFIYNCFYFPKNLYSLYLLPDLKIILKNHHLSFINSTSRKSSAKLPQLRLPSESLNLKHLQKVTFAPYEQATWQKFSRYHFYLQYELLFKDEQGKQSSHRFTALCDENAGLFKTLFLIAQQNHYRSTSTG